MKQNIPYNKGFTLFEVMVTITIFTVLTSVIIFKHSRFRGHVVLSNLGYEVALAIRQAQVYGVNVKNAGSIASPDFQRGYGVHFYKLDGSIPSTTNSFVLFADRVNSDLLYNNTTEDVEVFKIQKGYSIQKYCGVDFGDKEVAAYCSEVGRSTDVQYLDISFKRPDPSAVIKFGGLITPFKSAKIYLTSSTAEKPIVVRVDNTGQISVAE